VSSPIQFLQSLAHTLATMALYAPDHPKCADVVTTSFERLQALLEDNPTPTFSFLKDAVVYGNRPLHQLKNWPWSRRLSELGIQRFEIREAVTRDAYLVFLRDVTSRLPGAAQTEAPLIEHSGLVWGSLGIKDMPDTGDDDWDEKPRATIAYRLGEEAEVVRWVYERAASTGEIPRDEVETVVASLSVAMHSDLQFFLPLLELTDHDEYRTMHALNVSLLTMTLAESLGMGSHDIHAFGTAGLLHDIGITKVPRELLTKPSLDPEDRAAMEKHPEYGAKILLARKGEFDLPAVVAYEHHMRPDGTGYPAMKYPRELHYASRCVTVCDVYDALRTVRTHRPAWEPARALEHIEEGAGTMFEAGVARAFVAMMRRFEARNALAVRSTELPATE
jgi:putative nucleotidyltransferase with HDIG domain